MPHGVEASLARRAAQASLALSVRPAETVRPFTTPFASTKANGASLLSPTVRSASSTGLYNATMGKVHATKQATAAHDDNDDDEAHQTTTRFSLPGSQLAPQHFPRDHSPLFGTSAKHATSGAFSSSSLNAFASLSASAAQVASTLIPAAHYFADDPAARIDWSSWENHLPASGLPSLGATKPEIRKFLHPDRDDDATAANADDDPDAAAQEAIARAKRAEVVAKWPAGLETHAPFFVNQTLKRAEKPFNSFKKHNELARTVHEQQLDTKFHLARGATMTADANARRDIAIRQQQERAFTAQAARRTRYMLGDQVDRETGLGKAALMSTLGLTQPFAALPTDLARSRTTAARPATVAVMGGVGGSVQQHLQQQQQSLDTARSDRMETPRFPGCEAWLSAAKKRK